MAVLPLRYYANESVVPRMVYDDLKNMTSCVRNCVIIAVYNSMAKAPPGITKQGIIDDIHRLILFFCKYPNETPVRVYEHALRTIDDIIKTLILENAIYSGLCKRK
jgi:hypothetical protein